MWSQRKFDNRVGPDYRVNEVNQKDTLRTFFQEIYLPNYPHYLFPYVRFAKEKNSRSHVENQGKTSHDTKNFSLYHHVMITSVLEKLDLFWHMMFISWWSNSCLQKLTHFFLWKRCAQSTKLSELHYIESKFPPV